MLDFFQHIYNGLLRFTPLKSHIKYKSNHKGIFPVVGFLNNDKIIELEANLGITINNAEYFEQALIHRSYLQVLSRNDCLSNERLEFLGDSVLGMIIAEYLFSLHTNVLEGELTKMRSWLVNKHSLAMCATKMNLDDFVMMSYSAEKSLRSGSNSILADAMEAIIAAIFLDSGLEAVRKFIINSMLPILMNSSVMVDTNYKSIFLEEVQAKGLASPHYEVHNEEGPDHDKIFTVGVYVEDSLVAEGKGKSKKQAEQIAAENAVKKGLFSDDKK